MTVQTTTSRKNHTGNGVTTNFAYNFLILEDSHLKVYFDDVLQGSGYTVNGAGNPGGGSVDFAVAPADQAIISLNREVPLDQLTDYTQYDKFPAETHERALDKLTMLVQESRDLLDRSLSLPPSVPDTVDPSLPLPQALYMLRWNATADGLENVLRENGVLSGSGGPGVGTGIDGDFYIDSANWDVYGPKAAGAWPSGVSMIGPTGPTGPTGPSGADGADGVFSGGEATVAPADTDKMALLDVSDSDNPKYATALSVIQLLLNTSRNLTVGHTTDVEALGSVTSITPDLTKEWIKTATITGNLTINEVADGNEGGCIIYLTVDGSGPYTVTLGTGVKEVGNIPDLAASTVYECRVIKSTNDRTTVEITEVGA